MRKFLFLVGFFIFTLETTNAQTPCPDGGTIILNGDAIDAVLLENESTSGLKLPIWLDAGSTIAAGQGIKQISVIEFNEEALSNGGNSLVYNQVITVNTTSQTVPANKVWKVESIVKTVNPFSLGRVASSNAPVCDGDNIVLSAPSVMNAIYSWSGPNGFSSVSQNPTINNAGLLDAGDYAVTITLNGCTYTQAVNVAVNPLPVSTFTNSFLTAGYNGTFTPTISGLASYSWVFDNGTPATSNQEITSTQWASAGNNDVTLTVVDSNGCASSTTNNVTVSSCFLGDPKSDFTWTPPQANINTTFSATQGGMLTYTWSFDQATPNNGSTQNATTQWSSGGAYTVTLVTTDAVGCYTTIQNVTVFNGILTFTNCGQIGPTGPTISQCNNEYSGTSLDGLVGVTGGIQEWTVPIDGTYWIQASGAKGGGAASGTYIGGEGVIMSGEIHLLQGQTLKILVGQEGARGQNSSWGHGGGGGTFVTLSDNTPIIIAGGGGGASPSRSRAGLDATTNTCGVTGFSGGAGGCAGNGGAAGYNNYNGGGGGLLNDGLDATRGGKAFANGGNAYSQNTYYDGGFGGGGSGTATTPDGGGGGGGYSGGGAGTNTFSAYGGGGGGGSYIDATATNVATSDGNYDGSATFNGSSITNLGSYNAGHGQVVIYY